MFGEQVMQMILKEWKGKLPQIAEDAFIAEDAVLIGDVHVASGASIWYGCILRADTGRIVIGEGSNVQDGTIMHCDKGYDVVVGRGVTIGHGAIVHGAHLEDHVLIGMRANDSNAPFAEQAGLKRAPSGFMEPRDMFLGNARSNVEGIFYAGCITAPKNIGETLNEGTVAADAAMEYLRV